MKNVFFVLSILVVAGGGFLLFSRQPLPTDMIKSDDKDEGVLALSGEVTEVNLEEMMVDGPGRVTFRADDGVSYRVAVPSMGRNLCAAKDSITDASLIAVGDSIEVKGERNEEGHIVPCEDPSHYLRVTGNFRDEKLGMTFSYRKGPNGYIIEPMPETMSDDQDFVRGYTFMLEKDRAEMQNTTVPREGPPTLSMRAYQNPEKEWASLWPKNHAMASNVELASAEPIPVTIGGANGVRYTVDGLYPTDTYVVAHGSYVFVFTGSYLDENSPQKTDIETLIHSVAFIPEKG